MTAQYPAAAAVDGCNLQDRHIADVEVAVIGADRHWFQVEDHRVHKTVQHYLLEYVGGELCGDDHEVAAVAWVPLNELESRLAYPDERDVVARATAVLHEGLHGGRRP